MHRIVLGCVCYKWKGKGYHLKKEKKNNLKEKD